jgi:intracellular septation protein
MKLLFDLFPVLLFFGIFKWGKSNPEAAQSAVGEYLSGLMSGTAGIEQAPILLATAVAIVATFAQIGWLLARRKKVDPMLWVSLAIITVFGGATIYFHDDTFIKWKPTVLYWFFGAALLAGQFLFRKNLIRLMMGKQITLPDPVWDRLSMMWTAFFAAMGLLNLFVAFRFSTETWVDFKLFGFTGLMFAFIIAQTVYLSRYIKE